MASPPRVAKESLLAVEPTSFSEKSVTSFMNEYSNPRLGPVGLSWSREIVHKVRFLLP